jgi:CheY-like chemotaxis protein
MWIRIRAVIIEDEPLAAQYLAELLDDTCQVEVVGTAGESEAGLRLCAELRPDAVFVDINLPGKDGVSLAKQLAMLPQPPRLVFTHPLTGFSLTLAVSLVRRGLICVSASNLGGALHRFGPIGTAAVMQGLGTALMLAVVARVRDHDEQTRAAASAEVRALQARMNPHFLFNALNALAALATFAPREIPRAAGRLRHFLRASFDQHERPLVPLEEELAVVRAYLDIESLRFGNRLKVEENIAPELSEVLVPPFSLQPLVENAVQHGLQSSARAGRLRLAVHMAGEWLEMSVCDDGEECLEGSRTSFLRGAPESPRAIAVAPSAANIVRSLVPPGGM